MKVLKNKVFLWVVGILIGLPAVYALLTLLVRWAYNDFFTLFGAAPLSVQNAAALVFWLCLISGLIIGAKEVK